MRVSFARIGAIANHMRDIAASFCVLHNKWKKRRERNAKLITRSLRARPLSRLDNYEYNVIRVLIRGARDQIGSFNGCVNY